MSEESVYIPAKIHGAHRFLRGCLQWVLIFSIMLMVALLVDTGGEISTGTYITAVFYTVIAVAVLILMQYRIRLTRLSNKYKGREIQLGKEGLIIHRFLLDTWQIKEGLTHEQLRPFIHEKGYYFFPITEINSVRLGGKTAGATGKEVVLYLYLHSLLELEQPWFIFLKLLSAENEQKLLEAFEHLNIPVEVEGHLVDRVPYLGRYSVLT